MTKHFTCTRCGDCCGPVPVSINDVVRIKKFVKLKMSKKDIERLKSQKKPQDRCIFYDMERKACSIYAVRPLHCRMFGLYSMFECENNPDYEVKTAKEGMNLIRENEAKSETNALLTVGVTWRDFE